MTKYVAVETTISCRSSGRLDEFEENDAGYWKDSPQEAWDLVSDVFYAPCTIIVCTKGYIHNHKVNWKGSDNAS